MTDEHGMNTAPEPTPPPGMAEPHDDSSVLEGAGDFTSGEGLVAFAGMVIIAVWIIFSILATEYFISFLTLLLATAAAVLPRLDRSDVERVHPLPVVMKVLGYSIALLGIFTVVEDIRFEALDEVWAIIGGVITYGASIMAFVGARQIKI